MVEFIWIKLSLVVILMLQVTGDEAEASTITTPTTISLPAMRKTTDSSKVRETWTDLWPLLFLLKVLAFLFCLGLTAYLAAVIFIIWKNTKGNKREIKRNTTDSDEGLPYTSISFNKKTNDKVLVQSKDEDDGEDDKVTYTTVIFTSSSPAGASTDPNIL
ncbi:hypothetical protein Q8A73_018167 [Channa argus]|nr:hypothetical protein Q8A73_018167 [Channa argus]